MVREQSRPSVRAERQRRVGKWIYASLLLAAACGLPRPADVGDDAASGCTRDQDCGGTTPFCVDAICAVCRRSTNCPASRPVCDMTNHDCRGCALDSECDSGACDVESTATAVMVGH